MKTQNKFWWFVAVAVTAIVGVLCAVSILFWQQLPQGQKTILLSIFKENFAYFFTVVVLLFTAFGFTIDWFFRFYIIPVNQLAEAVDLINTVNPLLEIKIEGSYDVMRLADIINSHLEQRIDFKTSLEKQLAAAKDETEIEKRYLVTLLEDLPQGILVCNSNGDIVFFNKKIKSLLSPESSSQDTGGPVKTQWIGLGRSVFGVLDKSLVNKALERIREKLQLGKGSTSERFLISCPESSTMLPAEMKPVLGPRQFLAGYIIFVDDQSLKRQREIQRQEKLQAWRYKITQSISVIKATADILKDGVETFGQGGRELVNVLVQEADHAAELVKGRSDLFARQLKQPWPLTPIDAAQWGRLLQRRARELGGIELDLDIAEPIPLLSVDLHHLTISIVFVLQHLKQAMGVTQISGRLFNQKNWIYLKLRWQGDPIEESNIEALKQQRPSIDGISLNNTLAEILEFHGGGVWVGGMVREDETPLKAGILIYLPLAESEEIADAISPMTLPGDSRPEFYDFNLFRQSGQTARLNKRPLSELTYTVLDTETTGLDPQGGDEIISISAVRIVRGRLLTEERFNQLINPRRSLPWESVKYHGIRPEMLENQPYVEEVLPRFQDYARDTTLVGHNVAFDMRMLQLKEAQAGVQFDNPVLDTLLLSALIHPAHKEHTLEAVAERFGVAIVGRHTALGDATATAQIFLKMLTVLAGRGIYTLEQALKASEKTYYARLKY